MNTDISSRPTSLVTALVEGWKYGQKKEFIGELIRRLSPEN
jgi:hypothetical protein